MCFKSIISVLVLLTLPAVSFSNSKLEVNEKIMALSAMKKYAEAVSCGHSFEGEKNLRSLLGSIYSVERDEEIGYSSYYVLWFGDVGCNAGSGTSWYRVSEVTRLSNSRPFLVGNPDAFGEDFSDKINTRFIESMKKVGDEKFLIVSSEFDKNDVSNNFPSNRYAYTVERVKNEWKVTGRKFLGKKTY